VQRLNLSIPGGGDVAQLKDEQSSSTRRQLEVHPDLQLPGRQQHLRHRAEMKDRRKTKLYLPRNKLMECIIITAVLYSEYFFK
jgi:hypothetical protein